MEIKHLWARNAPFFFPIPKRLHSRPIRYEPNSTKEQPMLALAHGAACGRPFHAINSIQFHPANILTSASFTPPPRKSFLQRLVEFLNRSVKP